MVNKEIELTDFMDYLKRMGIGETDRVIVNGGEPFLHSQIVDLLKNLKTIGCEVLIYTNGTLLQNYDFDFITSKFRFVIPVHGYADLHDYIVCNKGGFDKIKNGVTHLAQYNCLIDIKIILNDSMINNDICFDKTLEMIDTIEFNNAIHIQKMADTIISKKNNCPSVSMDSASVYTAKAFCHFKDRVKAIKLFDTCVKDIEINNYVERRPSFKVYFKDWQHEKSFPLKTTDLECKQWCSKSDRCFSAVDSYVALEYRNGLFYKALE